MLYMIDDLALVVCHDSSLARIQDVRLRSERHYAIDSTNVLLTAYKWNLPVIDNFHDHLRGELDASLPPKTF
jgi:hypothetical protein